MTNRAARFVFLTLCILLLAGCDNKASNEIDFGTVKNSVYQNDYFGLILPVPSDWSVQDQKMRQKIAETGS